MAFTPRTIAQIQTQIQQSVANNATLSALLTSTSVTAIWNLFTYIMAVAIAMLEQIMLVFWNEVETIVSAAVPGTAPWIQAQCFLWEYGNTITLNANYTLSYAVPNAVLQIISACAVVTGTNGQVNIKAVTGASPSYTTLTTLQLNSLKSYLSAILPAGMNFNILSVASDTLTSVATIYYNGQYTGAPAAAFVAYQNYLASLPFNGVVKISAMEQAILAVPGVTDIVWTTVSANTTLSIVTPLITAGATINREYPTYAGYIVDSGSSTFTYIISNT